MMQSDFEFEKIPILLDVQRSIVSNKNLLVWKKHMKYSHDYKMGIHQILYWNFVLKRDFLTTVWRKVKWHEMLVNMVTNFIL